MIGLTALTHAAHAQRPGAPATWRATSPTPATSTSRLIQSLSIGLLCVGAPSGSASPVGADRHLPVGEVRPPLERDSGQVQQSRELSGGVTASARAFDDEGRCTRGNHFIAPVVARRERLALSLSGPPMDARPGSPAHERGLRDADAARLHLAAVLAMEYGTAEAWEALNYWLAWEREAQP